MNAALDGADVFWSFVDFLFPDSFVPANNWGVFPWFFAFPSEVPATQDLVVACEIVLLFDFNVSLPTPLEELWMSMWGLTVGLLLHPRLFVAVTLDEPTTVFLEETDLLLSAEIVDFFTPEEGTELPEDVLCTVHVDGLREE